MASNEAAVIAAVCKNKDIHLVISENEEIFGAYGDTFTFIREYYMQHKSVPEPALLEERFGDLGLPETTAPTAYYMDQLRESFVRSRMEEIMLKAGQALKSGSSPEVLGKLMTSLSKLGQHTSSVRDLSLMDVDAAAEYFDKKRGETELGGGTPGIATGFDSIDSAYPTGLSGGHSVVLMGYSGKGKSMWSGLLGVNAWAQGKKVMVVSLEMTPEEYRDRIYTMMADGQFSMSDMSRGDMDEDTFRTWAVKKFKDANDFIVVSNEGSATVTPNSIQAKIDAHRPDIVVLDYLQLMSDNAETPSMTPRMMNLSREVKLLAVSNNIPVVSITAVTDDEGKKREGPPQISQIAWSRGIEYDSNLVIAVHLHDETNIVEIAGRKNRHGPLFACYFQVDFDRGRWVETFDFMDAA